ncbi:hypothetical protein FHX15_001869 [Rhizobium sp. BK650]|uniref:GFA family protein n=1 Tax=Rhizobium sp. BK650 TaxID=2586990 RepID=UPI00160B6405|nr:hypothetical protein [Rhizobium sp. BK650]MBB3656641.1 hypothetical protein [Rhizobium sp. BK650]
MTAKTRLSATCTCGQVALAATGAPILSAVCYCGDCRTAARQFEAAPGAPPVLSADGGVDYCLFRKDRVAITSGEVHLREHRLTEASPTRRVVAACCNTPMFLDFTRGHWLTIFRDRLPASAPPVEMGLMVKQKTGDRPCRDGLPAYPAYPAKFMIRVVLAWAGMGFRRPTLTW